jgi:hypothetical protein
LATYDPSYDPYGPERRVQRDVRLNWGAIAGGTVAGWGVFFLLLLFGIAVRVYDSGATAWSAAAMVVSSAAGAFLVVRLAGERRSRSGRMEAIVGWGLSMTAGALFALLAWRARILAADAALATAASLVSVLAALCGATIAAKRGSGRALPMPSIWRPARQDSRDEPGTFDLHDASDEPTILPPAH